MRHVSITELVEHTGLSRATVDRVMNGRGRVHPRTRQVVEETLRALAAPAPARSTRQADLVLRVGRGMSAQMKQAWEASRAGGDFHDFYQADEAELVDAVAKLCADPARPLIITAKNTPRLADVLREARSRGKRIITLVSDLAADCRDGFVGMDNRAAGQTAAFLIGRTLGDRPTMAAVVVGDTAFTCHEDREIGFRTGLRAHFPKVILAGEARGEDNPQATRQAVLQLLQEQPALAAIYNVGGGNMGLVQAIAEADRARDVLVIGHEANHITAPLLRDGHLDFAIAANPARQLQAALDFAAAENPQAGRMALEDFAVYTRFNLPGFSQMQEKTHG